MNFNGVTWAERKVGEGDKTDDDDDDDDDDSDDDESDDNEDESFGWWWTWHADLVNCSLKFKLYNNTCKLNNARDEEDGVSAVTCRNSTKQN